jgi:hypothetical protein
MLGFYVVLLGLCFLFTRGLLGGMDIRTHGLAEVTEPPFLGGLFSGMSGRRGRFRNSTSESMAPMTLALAGSILTPATLRSIRTAMAAATVIPTTMAAAASSAVITTASTVVTAPTATASAALTATILRVGGTLVSVAKWHLKVGQEWDDQHGKDRC